MTSYSSASWRRLRLEVFDRDNWCCRFCGVMVTQGKRSRRSAVGEHLQPAKLAPHLFLDPSNVWTACRRCHDTECAAIEARHWEKGPEFIRKEKEKVKPLGFDGYRR